MIKHLSGIIFKDSVSTTHTTSTHRLQPKYKSVNAGIKMFNVRNGTYEYSHTAVHAGVYMLNSEFKDWVQLYNHDASSTQHYEFDVKKHTGKVQLPDNKSRRLIPGKEGWASILSFTFGRTWTAELSAPSSGRTLPRRKFLGTYFC